MGRRREGDGPLRQREKCRRGRWENPTRLRSGTRGRSSGRAWLRGREGRELEGEEVGEQEGEWASTEVLGWTAGSGDGKESGEGVSVVACGVRESGRRWKGELAEKDVGREDGRGSFAEGGVGGRSGHWSWSGSTRASQAVLEEGEVLISLSDLLASLSLLSRLPEHGRLRGQGLQLPVAPYIPLTTLLVLPASPKASLFLLVSSPPSLFTHASVRPAAPSQTARALARTSSLVADKPRWFLERDSADRRASTTCVYFSPSLRTALSALRFSLSPSPAAPAASAFPPATQQE